MKNCKTCLSEIHEKAKRCPYCSQWQTLWKVILSNHVFWVGILLFCFYATIIFFPSHSSTYEDFLDYRDQIKLNNVHVEFGNTGCKDVVAILGEISNTSNVNLKDLHFDVSFYDASNQLIDSFNTELNPFFLPATSVKTFKVSTVKEFDNSKYFTHKIFVSWAKIYK